MAHAKRHRQLIEAYDRRIPAALLEAADVLLTEPGEVRQLLLSQAFFLPDPFDVPPDQLAHVHAPRSADNDPVIYQLQYVSKSSQARTGRNSIALALCNSSSMLLG